MDAITIICPCCHTTVDVATETSLLDYAAQAWNRFASFDYKPWYMRSAEWIMPVVQQQKIQWACNECLVQQRALPGDLSIQKWCDYPPHFAYYDLTRQCSDCQKEFVWSKTEQHYWYEQLLFWVQSLPNQCLPCRRHRRKHNAANQSYYLAVRALDDAQPLTHVQAAQAALAVGYLRQAKMHLHRAQQISGKTYSIEELQALAISDNLDQSKSKNISDSDAVIT